MRDRVEELIDFVAEGYRRLKHMEDMTGIKADSWKNACRGQQRFTQEMIEKMAEVWPQYAYWLVTGRTDEGNGHTSPILERIARDLKKVRGAEG
jgi:hypothetical protein